MKQNGQPRAADDTAVTLEPVRPTDYQQVTALHPHPHQQDFVASNEESLEDAEENPACVPLLIRAGGEPVGFAMYALDEDDGNYWIYRLMIDARHQGKGYGRAALKQLLALLSELPDCPFVILGLQPGNDGAQRLYEQTGFRMTGEVICGERIMKYEF
ncbi:GNAT family N-acetyltransferase [Brucella pseudintermedia]|uniref:GNAT family N-acetyltransferase n=1 Tax=Brucella pseudintermedia TaxID=370111 RepID=UPI001589D0D8|nr:GNAT family N-acetyltransferase [Brucella pseudintermedia]